METLCGDILRHVRFDGTLDASHDHNQLAEANNSSNNNNNNNNITNTNSTMQKKNATNKSHNQTTVRVSGADRQRHHIASVALLATEMSALALRHQVPLGASFHAGSPFTYILVLPIEIFLLA